MHISLTLSLTEMKLATVIYDLPLITIPVSNSHLFSDTNISQGSVATRLRCGGICRYHFIANLLFNSERILKIGQDLTKLPP